MTKPQRSGSGEVGHMVTVGKSTMSIGYTVDSTVFSVWLIFHSATYLITDFVEAADFLEIEGAVANLIFKIQNFK